MTACISAPGSLSRARLDALTGARGLAAMLVFCQHAGENNFLPWVWPSSLAVSFFFVLSGFVLSYVYGGNSCLGVSFFRARFGRIWPASIISMLLIITLLPRGAYLPLDLPELPAVIVFILSVLMLQSLIPVPDVYYSLNSVTWSVSAEWIFYLFFPWLNKHIMLRPIRALSLIVLLGASLACLAVMSGWGSMNIESLMSPTWEGITYINPFVRICEFSLGIFAGHLWVDANHCGSFRSCVFKIVCNHRVGAKSFWEASVSLLLLLSAWLWRPLVKALLPFAARPLIAFVVQLGVGVFLSLLVLVLAAERGFISRVVMCNSWMLKLGELSFGLYLFHQPLMRWLAPRRESIDPNIWWNLPSWSVFPLLLMATLALSAISHYLLEPPARRLISRF